MLERQKTKGTMQLSNTNSMDKKIRLKRVIHLLLIIIVLIIYFYDICMWKDSSGPLTERETPGGHRHGGGLRGCLFISWVALILY